MTILHLSLCIVFPMFVNAFRKELFLDGLSLMNDKSFIPLCSIEPKAKFISLRPSDSAVGITMLIQDPVSLNMYNLSVDRFNHNWMPIYGSNVLYKTVLSNDKKKSIMHYNEANVLQRVTLNPKNDKTLRLAIRETVLLRRNEPKQPSAKPLFRMISYSNEVLGCPPVLCLNPALDAAFFDQEDHMVRYFRGFYMWEAYSVRDPPPLSGATFIVDRYPGVPNTIDAASHVQILNQRWTLFIKDQYVYLHRNGLALEYHINEVFPASGQFNDQYFIDDIIEFSNSIMLAFGGTFCEFIPKTTFTTSKWYEMNFIQCYNYDNGGVVAYINAAITQPVHEDKLDVFLFSDWVVRSYSEETLYLGLTKPNSLLKDEESKARTFPHILWACPTTMYKGFVLNRKMYEDTYVKTLSRWHESSKWNLIKPGAKGYDTQLLILLLGLLATFLAVCYGMLFFVGIYYLIMQKTIKKKLLKTGRRELDPAKVSEKDILSGLVTASQLLDAGVISPSTLQTLDQRSTVSKIGAEYSSIASATSTMASTMQARNSRVSNLESGSRSEAPAASATNSKASSTDSKIESRKSQKDAF